MKCHLAAVFVSLSALVCQAAGADVVVLARGDAAHPPQQPQVAVDANGVIHVAWGQGNTVYYTRSDDGGGTFRQAAPLPGTYVMSLGKRRGPRIAAGGEAVCITFVGGKQGRGRDGDVLACRSMDGGRTWTEPATVNDVADSAREGLHAMAAGPAGELCCVWLDLRSSKTEIYAATSRDGGASWDKNVRVYRSPSGSVCECCHPSVAFDASGRLHVMWRNSLTGKRDMYFATSSDGGRSFGPAAKLGQGTWPLDACPMDGGYLAVAPDGGLIAAWRRDKQVFLSEPDRPEQRLGAGEQPWIAATAKGAYVAWIDGRPGRLMLKSPGHEAATVASGAGDPVIAAPLAGAGPVVLAWEQRHGREATVVCQVLARP